TCGDTSLPAPTPSEHAAAVLNLVDDGVIEWNDPEVLKVLNLALKIEASRKCTNKGDTRAGIVGESTAIFNVQDADNQQ
ncbi:TPA: hypothetical protein ACF3IH_004690, partial [Escherichia coli]|nr:hypothetical protein [Escherichia albertii]